MVKLECFYEPTLAVQSVLSFSTAGQKAFQENAVVCDPKKGIFAVCDGFGGPVAGAAASELICKSIQNFLTKTTGDEEATLPFVFHRYLTLASNVLINAVCYAHHQLMAWNHQKLFQERGGGSVLAGLKDQHLFVMASVGVCSGWILRSGRKKQVLFSDHLQSFYDPFFERGSQESGLQKGAPIPRLALGLSNEFEPTLFEYQFQPQDWLILSTDDFGSQPTSSLAVPGLDSLGAIQQQVAEQRLPLIDGMKRIPDLLNQLSFQENVSLLVIVL